jgi:hypothetical protein
MVNDRDGLCGSPRGPSGGNGPRNSGGLCVMGDGDGKLARNCTGVCVGVLGPW